MNLFAIELHKYRVLNKLTIHQLAKKIGASSSVTSYYERGLRTPSLQKMIKIFKILNIPICHLFVDSPPTVPTSDKLALVQSPTPTESPSEIVLPVEIEVNTKG